MNVRQCKESTSRDVCVPLQRRLMVVAVWAFFAITAVWFVGSAFFGQLGVLDEGYMALCCRDWANQPMAMLTFCVGGSAIKLFGDQLVTLRILAIICWGGAVAIPCRYFYRRTGNLPWSLFLAGVGLITVRCTKPIFYSWDSGPALLISWLLTLQVSYLYRPGRRKAAVMSCVLAALVMARVPTGMLAIPASVFAVAVSGRRHGIGTKRIVAEIGRCAVIFIIAVLLLATMMKGSPWAYVASWTPDNIITGHGVRDMIYGYVGWMRDDLSFFCYIYGVFCWTFVALAIMLLFRRRNRMLPGLVLMVCLCYRNVVHYPLYFIGLSLVALIPLHNLRSWLSGRRGYFVRFDWALTVLVLLGAFVPVVGSDRIIMRITFFYSFPLLMLMVYPLRGGIIRWVMAFMVVPALISGIRWQVHEIRVSVGAGKWLPRHSFILEYPENIAVTEAVGEAARALDRSGADWSFFGDKRYGPSYIYIDTVPYRLNKFHFYYEEETMLEVNKFASRYDALIVHRNSLPALSHDDLERELLRYGLARTDSVEEYYIYKKSNDNDTDIR